MASIQEIVTTAAGDFDNLTPDQFKSILMQYPNDPKAKLCMITKIQDAVQHLSECAASATAATDLLRDATARFAEEESLRQIRVAAETEYDVKALEKVQADLVYAEEWEKQLTDKEKTTPLDEEDMDELKTARELIVSAKGNITYYQDRIEKKSRKVKTNGLADAKKNMAKAHSSLRKARKARDTAQGKVKKAEEAMVRSVFRIYKPDDPTTLAVRAIDAQIKDLRKQAAAIKVEISKLVEDRRRLRPSKKRKAPPADGPNRTPPSPARSSPMSDPESEIEEDEDNDSA